MSKFRIGGKGKWVSTAPFPSVEEYEKRFGKSEPAAQQVQARADLEEREMSMTANMISYFWFDKGDIERDVNFDDQECKQRFPAIYAAWSNYKTAKLVLDACVRDAKEQEDIAEYSTARGVK